MKSHKLGVDANYLATRHLILTGPLDEKGALIVAKIEPLIGVNSVSFNVDTGALDVDYDASKRQLDDIVDVVKQHGCGLSDGRWQRLKRGWYRYFDQNVKENAAQKPWRCH